MNTVQRKVKAFAVWITGLPASGKSTIAVALVKQLRNLKINVTIVESDAMRKIFSANPQYDDQERDDFYSSLAFIGPGAHGTWHIRDF